MKYAAVGGYVLKGSIEIGKLLFEIHAGKASPIVFFEGVELAKDLSDARRLSRGSP